MIQQDRNPLILFSGDFMSPSLQSVLMRGKHMVDAFNLIGVHFGTFGNHEFDYGLDALNECIHGHVSGNFVFAGSNTRWVMSNMVNTEGKPLGGALQYGITTWNGVHVGILGLSENWLPSCNQLRPGEAHYIEVFSEGERLAQMLKAQGAECVIALTHSRLQTDKEMSTRCPSIDLILGGHDHFYRCLPDKRLIKSGEEFEYLTEVELSMNEDGSVHTKTVAHPIVHSLPLDPAMEMIISRYDTRVQQRMGKVIGVTTVALDCTEACCRFKEGLLPGFFCDVMVERTGADFAILGGAAIAGKAIMPPGDITLGDVFNWFPGDTKIMTVRIPGSTVKKLLDVMVREVPDEAPSFPHPSAELCFTINTMTTPAVVQDVIVKGVPLDPNAHYTIAVEDFVGLGKAKYKFIPKEGSSIVDDEAAEQITYWIIDHFEVKRHKHRQSLVAPQNAPTFLEGQPTLVAQPSAMLSAVNAFNSASQGSRTESRGLAWIAQASLVRKTMQRKEADAYSRDVCNKSGVLNSSLQNENQLTNRHLMIVMDEVARLGFEASSSLDALSMALCEAFQRTLPCELVRCFHQHTASGISACLTPTANYRATRVAAHPRCGTYNHVRVTQRMYRTRGDVREDPYYNRPSEGHPHGKEIREMITIPIVSFYGFALQIQILNPIEPVTTVHLNLMELFASQVGTLVLLAHDREVKEAAEAIQKKVLESAVELLGGENIQSVKLFDQIATVSRLSRKIFGCRTASVFMVDYGRDEFWTVSRTVTSKKSHEDVVSRQPFSEDFIIAQAIESGLPTLQDHAAMQFLRDDLEQSTTMHSKSAERTAVLAVPIFAPGTEDVLCVLRLSDRSGNTFFTSIDEDAAISFSAFAAVAIQTGSEMEVLRTGVNRSQLKLFPLHPLNRIRWKRGWGSVRSKIKVIISETFRAKLAGFNVDAFDAFNMYEEGVGFTCETPEVQVYGSAEF